MLEVQALVQEVLSIAAVETLSFGLVQSRLVICDLSLTCLGGCVMGGTMQHVHGLLTVSLIPFLVLPRPLYPSLEVLYLVKPVYVLLDFQLVVKPLCEVHQ